MLDQILLGFLVLLTIPLIAMLGFLAYLAVTVLPVPLAIVVCLDCAFLCALSLALIGWISRDGINTRHGGV